MPHNFSAPGDICGHDRPPASGCFKLSYAFLPENPRGKHDDGYAGWFSLWCELSNIHTCSTDDYRLLSRNDSFLKKKIAIIFILENRLGIRPFERNTKQLGE